tara:strand:+ start:355 stop:489 length:135 start_codon:yes stop_codon:yes gene_type:complete
MTLLYVGPGLGTGTIILVVLILALVVFSMAYLLWARIKNIFKKK